MNKRILTTLAIGVLTAVCAFGFTACGGNGGAIPTGEEVTEEQWKAAFEATNKSNNWSADFTNKTVETVKGENEDGETVTAVYDSDYNGSNYATETALYSKSTATQKSTGAAGFGEEDMDVTVINEVYKLAEGKTLWSCYYKSTEYRQGEPEDEQEEAAWEASSDEYESEAEAKSYIADYGTPLSVIPDFAATEDGETQDIAELYSAFTYSNGKYTAVLYNYGQEYTVEISIKGGYVVGYSQSVKAEEKHNSFTETFENTLTVTFKNYGTTSVTAPAGATAAINAAKAE